MDVASSLYHGAMKSLKKERLSVMVTEAIKKMIVTENLQPGDKLYSEKQLSEMLQGIFEAKELRQIGQNEL